NSVDAIVCIPVSAAHESNNIYKTLSLYAQQNADAKQRAVVLLNVNWKQELESNPTSQAAIQKTIQEIKRAKTAFPELKIAAFQKKWTPEMVRQRKELLYGEVVKVLYDVASMSMEKAIRTGRHTNKDSLIITNDADAKGLRSNYLNTYLNALNRYPDSDAFTGLIRFGTETHGQYPGFGISTNIMMLLSLASSRTNAQYKASPSTPGANSGFRMSSFAAMGGSDGDLDGAGADTMLGRKLRAARAAASESAGGKLYGASVPITSSTASSVAATLPTGRRYNVVRHLVGAQLDTDADRFLGIYLQGRLVGSSWRDFDEGSYKDRRAELKGVSKVKEDPVGNVDAIARRIEAEISFLGTEWHSDPSLISWALGAYMGTQDRNGASLYEMVWQLGRLTFKFTDEGK
ncbi:MAG: hypothetical protein ACREGF_05375, partial [Candidatus Saccharimonadales bacterium]